MEWNRDQSPPIREHRIGGFFAFAYETEPGIKPKKKEGYLWE